MKPIGTISDMLGNAVGLLYVGVFLIIVYDVVLRYFFNSPTIWGLELVIALAGLQYVLGGAQALRDDAHVRIDFIYLLLPARTRAVMDVAALLITIGLMGTIAYFGALQAGLSWSRGETSGAGWNSHAPIVMKAAIPFGAGLMLFQAVELLIGKVLRIAHVG